MSVDKKISYKDQRLTKAQQEKIKPAKQGGGPNYLGKQETVTVPKKWLSSPDHVVAELAYITPREQKILLEADLYGSLKGKPNRGPGGIMSLQGDMGSFGGPSGDNEGGNGDNSPGRNMAEFGTPTAPSNNTTPNYGRNDPPSNFRQSNVMNPTTKAAKKNAPTKQEKEFNEVTKGTLADEDETKDFVGDTIFGPTQKYTGDNSLFGGANKYGYTDQYTDPTKTNFGDTKPGYGGRIMGGLLGLATGIPFIGGAIGSVYDKDKGFFSKQPKDMSEYNKLGLHADRFPPGFGIPNFESGDGDYDMLGNKINEITGEIISPTGDSLGFIPDYPEGPDGTYESGITTIIPEESSDQYVKLIEELVPKSTMPEDEELLGGFFSRYLPNKTPEEKEKKKEIEKMINKKFKYDYNNLGLGDMDGS